MNDESGFTVSELLLAVAVGLTLASVGVPRFADMVRKAGEGATKGRLGVVRSALSIYFNDMEGHFPTDDLSALTEGGKYLPALPPTRTRMHGERRRVRGASGLSDVADAGGWLYVNRYKAPQWGRLAVDCVHKEEKGRPWTAY